MTNNEKSNSITEKTIVKSCPFCDSDKITIGYSGQPANNVFVVCENCGATGPTDKGGRSGSGMIHIESAVTSALHLWNDRK